MTSLEEIKRLLAAATPGPWRVAGPSGFVENSSSDVATICQFWSTYEIDYDNWEANAQLIAKAPTVLAELIERVERLEAAGRKALKFAETIEAGGRDDGDNYAASDVAKTLRQALEESK